MGISPCRGQEAEAEDWPDHLSAAATARSAGPCVREWLAYHLPAGVQRFCFHDSASTDNTPPELPGQGIRSAAGHAGWP